MKTCERMLRKGSDDGKTFFIQALLDVRQSKPIGVNMREPIELEPMRKMVAIRRFYNKELRLTKKSRGKFLKFSEYCGLFRK